MMKTTMAVRPIRTEAEYDAALAAIRPYFDSEPAEGTQEADHFDLLAMVIEKYEDEHYPVPEADPVAAVSLVMEANGYTRADLGKLIGGPSRVSEFLNRRHDLSLNQIRNLRSAWRIPADVLIGAIA